jgi:RimJ/RimL family protein N-acetyltransferase
MDHERAIVNIVGERVALGPVPDDQGAVIARWMADFSTLRTLTGVPRPRTQEQVVRALEAVLADASTAVFAVFTCDDWRLIGLTQLTAIDHVNGTAEFHITIGDPSSRGRGHGTEATRLTLDYAFTALGLSNVMLSVLAYNRAGIRAYEKAGFTTFGVRRHSKRIGGRAWDTIYMEALADEFESPVLAKTLIPDQPG